MRTKTGLAIVWLLAAILAIAVSAAAVASVRSSVTDRPVSIGAPPAALADHAIPDEILPESHATTTTQPDRDPLAPGSYTSTTHDEGSEVTTTTEPEDDTPDPETSTSTTVTTSTEAPSGYTKTFFTDGGSVTIKVSGDDVTYKSAVPNGGWTIEVDDAGPDKVVVKFERHEDGDDDEEEIEFRAWVDGDELQSEVREEEED